MLDVNGRPTSWTNEREAELRRLWALGYSASCVARDMNVSRNTIIGKARRLGLLARSSTVMLPRGGHTPLHPISRQFTRPRQKPEPAPVTHDDALEFLHKQLLDLANHECLFPDGEGPYTFCGQPTARGTSWCRHHLKIVEKAREHA